MHLAHFQVKKGAKIGKKNRRRGRANYSAGRGGDLIKIKMKKGVIGDKQTQKKSFVKLTNEKSVP